MSVRVRAFLAAVLFLATACTTDSAGAPPLVARAPEDLAKRPWLKVYDEQTPNSIPQLVQGQELKTPEILQIVLEHVLKVLQGGADPKKTMDDAQQQAQARVAGDATVELVEQPVRLADRQRRRNHQPVAEPAQRRVDAFADIVEAARYGRVHGGTVRDAAA